MNTVKIRNLNKTFTIGSESITIFDGFNIELEDKSVAVMTGPSGSGKTTLLHMIASLDRPDSGSIESCGVMLDSANESTLSQYRTSTIGLMFQFHFLMKELTALENVLLPARMKGSLTPSVKDRAKELLQLTGLESRTKHFPSQLSGGERQRVSLCRALINDPKLILADEPTGNLDPKNSEMVEELLFSMARQFEKNLLVVTHDEKMAQRADIHWHLDKGQVIKREKSS